MDERDAKTQGLEVHRRDMAFVRGYVTCTTCACNYDCSQDKPGQRVPQWISVNDRLPEKFIEVLVFFDGQSTLCATGQYTDSRHDVAGWCYPAENRGCTDSGDDPVVTHWMPLPPPPVERAHGIEEVKR